MCHLSEKLGMFLFLKDKQNFLWSNTNARNKLPISKGTEACSTAHVDTRLINVFAIY